MQNNILSGLHLNQLPSLRAQSKATPPTRMHKPCITASLWSGERTSACCTSTLLNYVNSCFIQQYENTNHYHDGCKKNPTNMATKRQLPLQHFSGQLLQPLPSQKIHTNVNSGFMSCAIQLLFVCSLFQFCLSLPALGTADNVSLFYLSLFCV